MTRALRLEQVTPENVLDACGLRVRPEQEYFVDSVAQSLAEAYVHQDIAWPRLIVDGGRTVGFVMAFFGVRFDADDPQDPPRSGLWRLAVGAGEQGHGYGRFAVRAVCDEVRRRGGDRATVTYKQGENGPEEFYRRLGFRTTGTTSDGELLAELELPATFGA